MNYGLISPLSWLASESMLISARSGVSIGSSVYDDLDTRMTRSPGNIMVAYEQALYFLALGARRALREGETGVADYLVDQLDRVQAEGDAVEAEVNWLCSTFGAACPAGGSGRVLQDAIDIIEGSGLNLDDSHQIVAVLQANRRAFQIKQAVPVIVAVGLGAVIGTWWYRRKQLRA